MTEKVPFRLRQDPKVDWFRRFCDLRSLAAAGLADDQVLAATKARKARYGTGMIPAWDPPVSTEELAEVRQFIVTVNGKKYKPRKPGRS